MLNDISMMQALTLTAMMEKESLEYNEAGLANYRPENERSARLLERLGFVREGLQLPLVPPGSRGAGRAGAATSGEEPTFRTIGDFGTSTSVPSSL